HALEIKPGDTVVEIGPGDGMVTNLLLNKEANVICIEVDYDLIPNLIRRFGDNPNFHIVHKDVLDVNYDELLEKFGVEGSFKVTGSLPYNISKVIIRKLIEYTLVTKKFNLHGMSFILQDEVAKDYVAAAPKASFLSNYVRLFAEVKKFESIPAQQFYPMPKVNGGIVYLEMKKPVKDYAEIQKLIKTGFASPRKTLLRNLKNSTKYTPEVLDKAYKELGLISTVRPAEIETDMWIKLYEKLTAK
ncbi:MAG: ribosomal RNA small subunit methyltransferase A, partial [Candidatus Dojkabacteria bacterium]